MAGITEAADSPWAANPLTFVPKKDSDVRLCIDMRRLNDATRKDLYPLPRAEDMIVEVSGARYFTSIDVKSAYNAVSIHPDDRPKTAFYCGEGNGLMQFNRLVIGVSNAPSYFQRLMDRFLSGVEEECANRRSTPGPAPDVGSPEPAPPGNSAPVVSPEPDPAG